MKTASLFFTIFIFSGLLTFGQKLGDTIISNDSTKLRVKVLYFHITDRCNTCKSIEANLRKTIFENFQFQLDNGTLGLSIQNCELPRNAALVKKYDAYGATLAVTLYKNGKELQSEDLSNWAFQKVPKPEVFIAELKSKINELLKN
ncbi:MAG: nitrophenyl compound nitroreductase subunit ArsF family protein [Bacteroidia bacterium]|nr:nitrophenyl compound nitroreductase subunit ArsF family protein [Bacteroidia bacterium]